MFKIAISCIAYFIVLWSLGVADAIRMQTPSFEGSDLSQPSAAFASLLLSLHPKPNANPMQRTVGPSMAERPFRIGTRGSPLALAQAKQTKTLLLAKFPDVFGDGKREIKIEVIKSSGDMILDKSLEEVGGKGVFTKELDVALVGRQVEICVHSSKDVPTDLVEGTVLPCYLERENTSDVWISSEADSPEDLPDGANVGTASLRRQAQLKNLMAKHGKTIKCSNFRGNVQTRIQKIFGNSKCVNNTLLAYAGFNRMKKDGFALDGNAIKKVFSIDEMLPAIAQGAIGIQCNDDDEETLGFLAKLNHPDTNAAVVCERAFLRCLDGNCKTPIAGQAWIKDGKLHFKGKVFSADGSKYEENEANTIGDTAKPEELGIAAAKEVKEKVGDVFEYIGEHETLDELGKDTLGKADGLGGYVKES